MAEHRNANVEALIAAKAQRLAQTEAEIDRSQGAAPAYLAALGQRVARLGTDIDRLRAS